MAQERRPNLQKSRSRFQKTAESKVEMAIRIAMFSWESLHSIAVGGVAAHVTELAAALQHKGHEVHAFSGRCCTQKGPDHLVEAIPHVLRYYPRVDSVAWGLGTILKDLEWARWMGANGRIAVETAFTWDKIADITLQCYQS
jgi:glycosyltransferase involved in cell wall biosynthesis